MPKCPLCFAAYVALSTGLGLSFQTAACLRVGLILLCALSLGVLIAKLLIARARSAPLRLTGRDN
jgi:hypothetical protein